MKLTREVADTLLSALGRSGLVAEAQRLWRSMVWGRATLRPDRRTFLTAIRVFREGGALSQALHAYNGMRRAGVVARRTPSLSRWREVLLSSQSCCIGAGSLSSVWVPMCSAARTFALCRSRSCCCCSVCGMCCKDKLLHKWNS